MRYLPLYLDAHALPCLIVGGGEVAARKLAWLRRAGATVTLVAPERCPALQESEDFHYLAARFDPTHVDGQRLVIAATNQYEVNLAVAEACRARGIPVNVVDTPSLCSFIVPALVDRSPLIVSISTGGAAPVLATRVRSQIEALLPASLAALTAFMGEQRATVKARHPTPNARRRFWQRFLASEIPALLARAAPAAEAAFAALLAADLSEALATRESHVTLNSLHPGDLTLDALALLTDADRLVYAPAIPQVIRDYARRDAEVLALAADEPAPPAPGHTVYVHLRATGASPSASHQPQET